MSSLSGQRAKRLKVRGAARRPRKQEETAEVSWRQMRYRDNWKLLGYFPSVQYQLSRVLILFERSLIK